MSKVMNLSILSNSFFDQHSPSPEMFKRNQSLHAWSEKVVPIYEWNGVLYVGCAIPPRSIPQTEKKLVFVLCDEASLRKVWSLYQGESSETAGELLEGLDPNLQISTPESGAAEDLFSAMTTIDAGSKEKEEEDFLGSVSQEAPVLNKLSFKIPEAGAGPSPSSLSDKTEPISVNSDLSEETQDISFSAQPQRATPISSEIILSAKPQMGSGYTQTNAQRFNPDLETNKKPEDMAKLVFEEMSHYFTKSIIFLRETDILSPWKWSSNITPSPSATGVDFTQKSPFRIVFKTLLPYHGYVVPNDVNDKFFADYNRGETPDHLTVAPLKVDEHLIGVLVGIGEKSADNKNCLALTEKLAEVLSGSLQKNPNTLKAA